jgi:PAS domain S-box-containing protein
MGILYYAEITLLPTYLFRFSALIPIVLAIYLYGLTMGFMVSAFYSLAFLPQLVRLIARQVELTSILELGAFILFLNISTYIIADMLETLRSQQALKNDVKNWEALMSRTLFLDEVFVFLLQETERLTDVEDILLLVRTPMESEWTAITKETRRTLHIPSVVDTGSRGFDLAQWLLQQRTRIALNHLDQPDNALLQAKSRLRSLLAYPLNAEDGVRLGVIVLLNKQAGHFTESDFQVLEPLGQKSEKALQQAGLYAKTDQALTRRVEELTMIQRTARALNATLDPALIAERTLSCALDICRGQVGSIVLDVEGLPPVIQYRGDKGSGDFPQSLLDSCRDLQEAYVLSPETDFSPLSRGSTERLLVPIRLGERFLGCMSVERSQAEPFEIVTLYALNSLTEHTATALENARLFEDIRREKQRSEHIIQRAADGLFTVDCQMHILLFNPAAEELTGWSAKDVRGRSCTEVLNCIDACDNQCPLREAMETQKVVQNKRLVIQQSQGTKRVISISAAPLLESSGKVSGAVALFRDVTEREHLERVQREFIAAVSHELRAPLTKMSMTLEMIPGAVQATADDKPLYLDILKEQCQQLNSFADRILEVFRIERGELKLQINPIPLTDIISAAVQIWTARAPGHHLHFYGPQHTIWARADQNALQTILDNLLDNAVKYTPTGTDIEISLLRETEHYTTVHVRDDGPGIAPEDQNRVFDRFYRVDGTDAQTVYGHGLGLYIAKRLVEAMEGTIWVESDVGAGCQFAFTLPVVEENHE